MPVTATGSTGTNGNQVSATTLAITVAGGNVAVGDTVVVFIAADNAGASGASSISAPTDSGSNTYTQLRLQNRTAASAANDGCTCAIYASNVTTGLTSGSSTITCNFSPATTAKAIAYVAFRGIVNVTDYADNASSGTGTTYTSNATSANVTQGDLVLGAAANESVTPPAADGDTTNGTWVEATANSAGSGGDATKMALRYAYKFVSAGGGTQTFNGSTGASTDWAACISALVAILDRPPYFTPMPALLAQ